MFYDFIFMKTTIQLFFLAIIALYIIVSHKDKKKNKKNTMIGNIGESQVSNILKPYIHYNNLTFYTGRRTVQLDHIVQLKSGGFLIIETKKWSGQLSGNLYDKYIYVGTDKRLNPLTQIEWQKKALIAKVDKNVTGIVVSTGTLSYPLVFNESFLNLEQLKFFLSQNAVSANNKYRNWSLIESLISQDIKYQYGQKHIKFHSKRNKPSRFPLYLGITGELCTTLFY